MNYYERHLGDYARDTAHLSLVEHGVYTILLDRYYSTERGIPDSQKYRVARAHTKSERKAVDMVLDEFFYLDEDGIWINQRAQEEIDKYASKVTRNRENGSKGGRPASETKPTENPTITQSITQIKPKANPDTNPNETQTKAHQTPVTNIKETNSLSLVGKESPAEKPTANPNANPKAFVGKPSDITSVFRMHGITGNPANPKLMELVNHRIRLETVSAACQLARDRKPDERIPANYVIAILEGWCRESNGSEVKPRESKNAEDQRVLAELTGRARKENAQTGWNIVNEDGSFH